MAATLTKVENMYKQLEQPLKNKSKAITDSVTQKKSNTKTAFSFVDNRQEAFDQKASQSVSNDNAQTTQLKTTKVDNSNPIQRAFVGERQLGMKEVPEDYVPKETDYDSLVARHDKGVFHQHIFFEDGRKPGDIGFHDNELFHEPNMRDAYHMSIPWLNDYSMRLAVHSVGDPGTYHLLGNNCQAYVTKVMKQYNNIKGYRGNNSSPSKQDHQKNSKMGYTLF